MANDDWLAPKKIKIPDFIICGAMKSGTTTLHGMLNQHPDVFIPEKELHFFDRDNIIQHPDFNQFSGGQWSSHQPKDYWAWYNQQFSLANPQQLVGEDSTTYLASPLAAKRIALQHKAIKLVIMLRQPSRRAFSQYWHLVRSNRMPYRFEDCIKLNPHSVLNRSLYTLQIQQYLKYIPRENIHFVIFEEFIADKAKVLKGVCEHIGVDDKKLPATAINLHENATTYPKFYALQLLKNSLFPQAGNINYDQHFEHSLSHKIKFRNTIYRLINGVHRKINPLVTKKPKEMEVATKEFLDKYFINELEGLNELIGRDVLSLWFD
ncbi:MAG: hypothetical protein ACJAT7_001334 [Psychromonas sp.]|jgi:hypothetical protein|uniref:sulfotransferase family protein n=1 Tax=Psychromonas sp. TaxID=1884585 RepID=UPI0039E3342F